MSNEQDRACLCTFTFADGRRCQLPQAPDDMGLCYFHAQKFRQRLSAQEAGRQISEFLNTDILTACDLNSAFASLFSATAQGVIKPKTAASLAYLGQLMLQTQRLAKQEFLEAFKERWPKIVQESNTFAKPEPSTPDSSDSTAPDDSRPDQQDDPAQDDSAAAAPHPGPLALNKVM